MAVYRGEVDSNEPQNETGKNPGQTATIFTKNWTFGRTAINKRRLCSEPSAGYPIGLTPNKLTWLVLGEDPAARSHRVEQLTAL